MALGPFVCLWLVAKEIISVLPAAPDLKKISFYGWCAVLLAVVSMVIYFIALMCSHTSAFRVARNMRSKAMHHIIKLPIGYFTNNNTGVLNDVSFTVSEGETIALVGPSGSGKSTATSLIPRFFYVDKGSIKIDGVDVRNITKEDLMNKVSFVFQNTKFLKTSILENIRMAKPKATVEEVFEAAKKAQCTDIIEKFTEGINTVIAKNIIVKRKVAEGIQECLETVRDLKAYNQEKEYLLKLDNVIKESEKVQFRNELITGILVVSGQVLLKVGFATVILVGGTLLATGKTNLFVYLVFFDCCFKIL